MTTLDALIERLRGVTGPDREVDEEIYLLLDPAEGSSQTHYTGSVDAALAFADRVLPGWYVDHIGANAIGMPGEMERIGWNVDLHDGSKYAVGAAPTMPLALLLATLTALQQTEARS